MNDVLDEQEESRDGTRTNSGKLGLGVGVLNSYHVHTSGGTPGETRDVFCYVSITCRISWLKISYDGVGDTHIRNCLTDLWYDLWRGGSRGPVPAKSAEMEWADLNLLASVTLALGCGDDTQKH